MNDFLIEIEGCLYANPKDVVQEFAVLRAEIEQLRRVVRTRIDISDHDVREVQRLRADLVREKVEANRDLALLASERDHFRDALARYGKHDFLCKSNWVRYVACSCGFDALFLDKSIDDWSASVTGTPIFEVNK
jgi:hypothetical protein